MALSYSSLGIQRILMNGREVGEIETRAARPSRGRRPPGHRTGGRDGRREGGAGLLTCLSLSAERAQELIERQAARAFGRIGQIRPYRVDGPVSNEVEYTTRSTLFPQAPLPEGVERIGPRTLRFTGKDFLTAWRLWSMR